MKRQRRESPSQRGNGGAREDCDQTAEQVDPGDQVHAGEVHALPDVGEQRRRGRTATMRHRVDGSIVSRAQQGRVLGSHAGQRRLDAGSRHRLARAIDQPSPGGVEALDRGNIQCGAAGAAGGGHERGGLLLQSCARSKRPIPRQRQYDAVGRCFARDRWGQGHCVRMPRSGESPQLETRAEARSAVPRGSGRGRGSTGSRQPADFRRACARRALRKASRLKPRAGGIFVTGV